MVLLGGQGMNSISPELFLENETLYLSVYVDLNDGKGLRHLPPDQPIHSVPHALSADLAERAKVADGVATGAISKQMLGAPIQNQLDAPVSASRSRSGDQGLSCTSARTQSYGQCPC